VLTHARHESKLEKVDVGGCMEEDIDELSQRAGELGLLGYRCSFSRAGCLPLKIAVTISEVHGPYFCHLFEHDSQKASPSNDRPFSNTRLALWRDSVCAKCFDCGDVALRVGTEARVNQSSGDVALRVGTEARVNQSIGDITTRSKRILCGTASYDR
jgi:hypothetical protein